jgi:hypothetical protein
VNIQLLGCLVLVIIQLNSFSHIRTLVALSIRICRMTDDILNRRSSFIRQVNNILCYFRELDSHVKYKLFSSYCSIFLDANYGHSLTKRSMIYILHGENIGYGNCLIILIVLYSFVGNVCRC